MFDRKSEFAAALTVGGLIAQRVALRDTFLNVAGRDTRFGPAQSEESKEHPLDLGHDLKTVHV
jgi:hypothetical protein